MSQPKPSPRQTPSVAGAIYGVILGASIIVAAGVDHPGEAGLVEVYLCVTALVFYAAHVYARVIGLWIEGVAPTRPGVRAELRREWPMVAVQVVPASLLLLGLLDAVSGTIAVTLAFGSTLVELGAAVLWASRRAGATTSQMLVSASAAGAIALVLIALKIFVHG